MTAKKSKLRRELDKSAILLLKDAFPGNNPAKATAGTPPEGTPPTSLADRSRVFKAVVDYLAVSEKLDKKDDDGDDPGTANLSDLQRELRGTPGGRTAGTA